MDKSTLVQFVYLQEQAEAYTEEEHMFLGLHLCEKPVVLKLH